MLSTDIPKITISLIGYEDGILLDKQVHASINICTGEVADAVSPCRLPFGPQLVHRSTSSAMWPGCVCVFVLFLNPPALASKAAIQKAELRLEG